MMQDTPSYVLDFGPASPSGNVYVDQLDIRVGPVAMGTQGTPTMAGLLGGSIADLLRWLRGQAELVEFNETALLARSDKALLDLLETACWTTGEWPDDLVFDGKRPSPYAYAALPEATPLFDPDLAFIVLERGGNAKLLHRLRADASMCVTRVPMSDYIGMWESVERELKAALGNSR